MIRNIKHTLILLLAVLTCSCTKDPDEVGAPILFSIDGGLDVELTKSVINTDNLASNIIKVYAEKDASPITDASTAIISKPSLYWNYSKYTTWQDGHAYSFQGYAYNNSGFSSVAADGRTFTVTHSSNNIANTYDYVISRKVEVGAAESRNHPIVGLVFDHVLPAVQIYVTKAPEMKEVKITSMTLKGLYTKAVMKYSVGDVWLTEYPNGATRNASYKIQNKVVSSAKTSDATMEIISVPQALNSDTQLVINYQVDESMTSTKNWVSHDHTFYLSDFLNEIEGGHRVIFHVNIDTGIHLEASIARWRPVDFIEGTVLPPIDE